MGRRTITTRFAFEEQNIGILNQVNRGVQGFVGHVFSPAGAIAGVAALGAGIAALTTQYLQNADELSKMSQRTGVATEQLSGLRLAFDQADLSADDLEKALRRMNLREPGANIRDLAEEISNLDTVQEQSARAAEVFGTRLGPRMLTFLQQGAEGIDSYQEKAENLNLVIDQESADAAAAFNDNIDLITRVAQGAGTSVAMAIVNWSGPILQSAVETFGILPKEAKTQAEWTEQAFTDRIAEALLAGETLGEALTDPVIRRLQTMAQSAGVNVRLAIAAVERELRQQDLDNALQGFEGALFQGLTPQRSAELQALNFPNLSVGDILSESARRNPAFNAGGQTGAPEDLQLALRQALLLNGNPAFNAGGSTNVPVDFQPIEPELQSIINEIRRLGDTTELSWVFSEQSENELIQDLLTNRGDRIGLARQQLSAAQAVFENFQNFSGGGLTGFNDPYGVGGGIPSRFRNASPLNFRPIGAPDDIGLIPGYSPDNPVSVALDDAHPLNVRIVGSDGEFINEFLFGLNAGGGGPLGGINIDDLLAEAGIRSGRVGGRGGPGDPLGLIEASKNDPLRVSLAGLGGLNEDAMAQQDRTLRPINVDGNELISPDRLRNFILGVIDDYIN